MLAGEAAAREVVVYNPVAIAESVEDVQQHFKNARYIDAYGLTETFGGDTFMDSGREIEKIGGQLWNKEIQTVTDVKDPGKAK